MMRLSTLALAGVLLAGMLSRTWAADYFVTKEGRDANAGTTRAAAFATLQHGVNALRPGDTLTIGPGEYHEAVKRIDLGNSDRDTVIRAELAGTVTLRGDVPAPVFLPLAGHRFVFVADFPFAGELPAVNELDTLTILKRMPNAAELEFVPGTFFHDARAGKLYVSTSDMRPASAHHYSVSVLPTHGLQLVRPRRVVIEGLNVTGYSAMGLLHYREETAGGVWGVFLVNGRGCVIRDCRAYLNSWGIGLHSGAPGSGDNVIERCVAWANKSSFANGDMGGITAFGARRDVIRDSTAYLNGMYGINIYGTGGAPPNGNDGGNDPTNRSRLLNNLAWGNESADLKIKTGYEYFHVAEHCVAPGLWSVVNVTRGLLGREGNAGKERPGDSINLSLEPGLDSQREFADPANHDYRLQGTSRFRGTGPGGSDRGPFAFATNIFYVRLDGDDQSDGLSVAKAWKTLSRAASRLRAGDTLYVEPGSYEGGLSLRAQGTADKPIHIRGRSTGAVVISGAVRIENCQQVNFERLHFRSPVSAIGGAGIGLHQCTFTTGDTAVTASGVRGLKVSHCLFTGFQHAALRLGEGTAGDFSGNLFDNAQGVALRLSSEDEVRYSDYNSYRNANAAWEVNGKRRAWPEVQLHHDPQSRELEPAVVVNDGVPRLRNAPLFAAGGPMGKPFGPYRDQPRSPELRLAAGPVAHSVSATTANLEWHTSLPATCHLGWGETPACEQSASFNVNCFGTYSLTGLKPGQRYYFRIKAIESPKDMVPKGEDKPIELTAEPITFTTLKQNPAPATYYVATDGDDARTGLGRAHAWKTIRYAAAQVNVGDTILVVGGKYSERVRMRATGEQGLPITFRSLPGERVDLDGQEMVLPNAFIAGGKRHLRFDGFYFARFNLFPNEGWNLQTSGEFHLYSSKDIQITRCFSEGRGGYSANPVTAIFVEDLLIKNCVNTYKFGGMYFWRCPNLVIQNTVFAEPMIMAFVHRNAKQQPALMENCIFTDMLEKKAKLNLGVLCCDGERDAFQHRNNCYFLRDCIPLDQRALDGNRTASQLGQSIQSPLFADPLFAGDPGVAGKPADKSGFSPDRMMGSGLKLDFDSFFSTNPELLKRGIGLQPEAFKDFHFAKPPTR
ncbi:MAG: hypothetical protein RL514_4623 [Verrucomicrobiota bacterium]